VFKAFLSALAIFATALAASGATPAKPHKRHHGTAASSATHKPAKRSAKPTATASRATAAAAYRKGKPTKRPSRSYQQVPSPERYKEIQQALAGKGYLQGEPSGEWGSDSVEALKHFQTDQNLMPDGKISSLSLIALGLGPKRLTAKSDSAPPQPGTSAPLPAAPPQ
jgi:hypothetical protein